MKKGRLKLNRDQERLAGRLAGRILRVQRRMADWLNSRTKEFGPKLWMALLAALCAGFGGYCLRLVAEILPFFNS